MKHGHMGPHVGLQLGLCLPLCFSLVICDTVCETVRTASMLQRHFEAKDVSIRTQSYNGYNLSFENELKELYLQQLNLDRSLLHQDPTVDSSTPNISEAVGAVGSIAEGTADAIGNISDYTVATKAEIDEYVANHSTDKMMSYWFGPMADWECTNSSFSTKPLCGYFHGWLNWEMMCILLLFPVGVLVAYVYFILDLVLIDTSDPSFDDEEFRRQHGWSLVQHQWELKYIIGSVALPLELVILWQLGLLQVLLLALEPYFVAALIVVTGLAPIIITTYIQISRRFRAVYKRILAVEHMLESLTQHVTGNVQAIRDTFSAMASSPRGFDAKEAGASAASGASGGDPKAKGSGCC